MKTYTQLLTATVLLHKWRYRPIPRHCLLSAIVLAFGLLAVSPQARAFCREGCDLASALTFLGDDALLNDEVGFGNTAAGDHALYSNTDGDYNTATGMNTLYYNTIGDDNTAAGLGALFSNTSGSRNVAIGYSTLSNNVTGIDNTATGYNALYANTGNYNTADGYQALESTTTGSNNTASGLNALNHNTTGSNNSANGASALYSAVSASGNCAQGYKALYTNTTGNQETAIGQLALFSNTTGNNNTALGNFALYGNTTGFNNIAIGASSGFSLTIGNNNIDIGNLGVAGESGIIRIGTAGTQSATFIAAVRGVAIAGAQPVGVSASGQLGVQASSARFKEGIRPMDKASEAILALEPVTFHYKRQLDPDGAAQFGLVAEQVEKVNPDLVARDEGGKPYTVRYDAVNAMLLNEFLKEHRKGQEQDATISQLKSTLVQQHNDFQSALADQQKQIKALTAALQDQAAQIQKVSVQLVADKKTSYVVVNDR